jgi:phage terminase small subunit
VELQLTEEKTEVAKRRDTLEAKLTVTDRLGAQEQAKQWLAQMPSEEDSARIRLDPDR